MSFPPSQTPEVVQDVSSLQSKRLVVTPDVPSILSHGKIMAAPKEALGAAADHDKVQSLFPLTYGQPRIAFEPDNGVVEMKNDSNNNPDVTRALKVGAVLSGGQASGGHNVIVGLWDRIKAANPESQLFGFKNGPKGIMTGNYFEMDAEYVDRYRNTGGFDMLGSGRDKIEKPENFESSLKVVTAMDLDGLVVIGGDDSNTNAAVLGEYFQKSGSKCKVIGAPKTIDGDLKNEFIPVSFGFDTACRTYSELIGNVMLDCISSQKYYHFVRLMGRAASHVALECALQTHPNAILISEEIEAKAMSLSEVTQGLVDMIVQRSAKGKDYGVIVLPEGIIEFIPEFNALMKELNELMAKGVPNEEEAIMSELSFNNKAIFAYLPPNIKEQLLLDRDPHGNVQVAKIETEKLLAGTIEAELEKLKAHNSYNGKFKPQYHAFGYEGRAGLPSAFDCNYCYAIGLTAGALFQHGLNGYMCSIRNLTAPVSEWQCGGVPITMMMNIERRHGKDKPVIKKALVELDGKPFQVLEKKRPIWALNCCYRNPGPIQFFGPAALDITYTLQYEQLPEDQVINVDLKDRILDKMDKFIFSPTPTEVLSKVQRSRLSYVNKLPVTLQGKSVLDVEVTKREKTQCIYSRDRELMQKMFPETYGSSVLSINKKTGDQMQGESSSGPKNIGVVFCGRQTPGAHNVVCGIFDFLVESGSAVHGFIGGVHGLFKGTSILLTDIVLQNYRNQGGMDLLGRSQETFDTMEHMIEIKASCLKLNLDGLIMIGGTRTATGVAYLAEYFKAEKMNTAVVAVPCSIDGTMMNQFVETSVGYDTACKVYAQVVGNTAVDGASAKKYYYFLRLMGNDPSNIALEVALQAQPNLLLLAEDVDTHRRSLQDVVREVADLVCARDVAGKQYGVVLIPEGLIGSIPEIAVLINEIDDIMKESVASNSNHVFSPEGIREHLTSWSAALFQSMPLFIQVQLIKERQSNAKINLSSIETERLLAYFVEQELARRKKIGQYNGKFSPVCNFLGYQARGALPTNFDCNYAYSLGGAGASLAYSGCTSYLAAITGLKRSEESWKVAGIPITSMLVCDDADRHHQLNYRGQLRPRVIEKKVDLSGPGYRRLIANAREFATGDFYKNCGPVQFEGENADDKPISLVIEDRDYMGELETLHEALEKVRIACRPGCSSSLLHMATRSITTLTEVVEMMDEASSK